MDSIPNSISLKAHRETWQPNHSVGCDAHSCLSITTLFSKVSSTSNHLSLLFSCASTSRQWGHFGAQGCCHKSESLMPDARSSFCVNLLRGLIFTVHTRRGYIYFSWVRKGRIGHLSLLNQNPKDTEAHSGGWQWRRKRALKLEVSSSPKCALPRDDASVGAQGLAYLNSEGH
jgi:hypothetical protein